MTSPPGAAGPNGQPGRAELIAAWRDASARLYAAGTAAYDIASEVLTTGPRPGHAERVYDAAVDLRDLARTLSLIERMPRDNREVPDPEEHP